MAFRLSAVLAAASLVLAAPAPVPQGIDLALVAALPKPSIYSIAVGVASQTVANQAKIIASVVAEISSAPQSANVIVGDGNVLHKRTTKTAATTACVGGSAQPVGYGPTPSPDTPAAFQSFTSLSAAALAAPTPLGFTQVYSNLGASNNAYKYLGYTTLKSYDTNSCAQQCLNIAGCQAINVYFERDPTTDPGTGTGPGCANPSSTNVIKCVFWGAPLDKSTATNNGQYRNKFQVVIAGSNAYNLAPAKPAGYDNEQDLGNAAIDAPNDCNGASTYMGVKVFQNVPYSVQLCADACTATSNYDRQQGIPSKQHPQTCQFFVTYMLYKNANPIAQYCAMYNETWNATYATNTGQYDAQGNHYTIGHSYAFSNATDHGVCTNAGSCLQPYFGGSLSQRAVASADCSSFQAATITPCASTITTTSTSVSTAVSTITNTVTVTQTIPATATATSIVDVTTTIVAIARRTVGPAACPVTQTPTSTPSYAASCGGPSQYAAACAFYGIMSSTRTLSASTVTNTATVGSVSSIFDTAIITNTESLTVTDATVTTTVTSTVTTTSVAAATTTFRVTIQYPASDPGNVNIFGYTKALNSQAYFIDGTSNLGQSDTFVLDGSTGEVLDTTGPAAGDYAFYSTSVGASSYVLVTTSSFAASQGGTPLKCSIDASSNLVCGFGSQTAAWWLCGGHLNVVQPGYDFTNTCNQGTAEQVNIVAAPI